MDKPEPKFCHFAQEIIFKDNRKAVEGCEENIMKRSKVAIIGILAFCVVIAAIIIWHISSLNIIWTGVVETKKEVFATVANLPENAIQVQGELSQAELLRQALFLDVPLVILLIGSFIYLRKKKINVRVPAIAGVIISLVCMPIHEFMHGFAIPQNGTAYIGVIKENFSAYAYTNTCMSIPECICYYLIPTILLGIFPLIICFTVRKKSDFWHVFLLAFAIVGLIQTAPDWFGLYPILKSAPWDATIQMSDGYTYWFFNSFPFA